MIYRTTHFTSLSFVLSWLFIYCKVVQFSSITQSCLTLCNPMDCNMPGLPVHPNLCPLSRWCHPTIPSSVVPFSSCLQSSPASGSFKWVSSLNNVAKVLEFQLQHQPFQWIFRTGVLWDGLVGSPCSPRDSQESSTPQFKSINFSALSFPHSPTLTSIHDYWKIHSLD